MIRRGVERVEAMPFRFDIRPFRERESHPAKNADAAVEHLGEGVKRAELGGGAGKRDVDVGQCARFLCGTQTLSALLDRGGDGCARFVE